jgi:hypothetical protein
MPGAALDCWTTVELRARTLERGLAAAVARVMVRLSMAEI